MTCSVCDEAYHHMCHSPRISAPKQNTKWSCGDCSAKSHQTKQNNTGGISMALIRLSNSQSSSSSETRSVSPPSTVAVAAILPPVLSPQVSPPRSDADDKSEIKDIFKQQQSIDPNIPDASDWTTEQVYQYFARLFPKEAETFRNHVNFHHYYIQSPHQSISLINSFQLASKSIFLKYTQLLQISTND